MLPSLVHVMFAVYLPRPMHLSRTESTSGSIIARWSGWLSWSELWLAVKGD
jgi:hypothetical protein